MVFVTAPSTEHLNRSDEDQSRRLLLPRTFPVDAESPPPSPKPVFTAAEPPRRVEEPQEEEEEETTFGNEEVEGREASPPPPPPPPTGEVELEVPQRLTRPHKLSLAEKPISIDECTQTV